MEKKTMDNNKKKIITTVILIVCIIVFLVSAGFGVWKLWLGPYLEEKKMDKLNELVTEPTTSESGDPIPEAIPDYSDILAENKDTVGWITIPGTNIDYPVLQAEDNAYYLRRNFYRKSSTAGAIYMDYRNDAKNLDANTIIYGHNTYNISGLAPMFTDISKYEDIEFYKEHPVIEFNTLDKYYKWKICYVFNTNRKAADDNGYIFNYIYPYINGINFDGYMAELEKRMLYDTGVDVKPDDKFITLSACSRTFDPKGSHDISIVVVARMVRPGEEATVDTSAATVNPNPKYPQYYYNYYGLSNPYKDDEKWYPKENTD